jgi:hypothetical protein
MGEFVHIINRNHIQKRKRHHHLHSYLRLDRPALDQCFIPDLHVECLEFPYVLRCTSIDLLSLYAEVP